MERGVKLDPDRGRSESHGQFLYGALPYHDRPLRLSRRGRAYLGMDKKVHTAEPGYVNYSVFSLWDTFRALHPLMTIINPDLATDWGKVLVQGYKEGGILPKWPLALVIQVVW
mgnify:CR=1 FL=1